MPIRYSCLSVCETVGQNLTCLRKENTVQICGVSNESAEGGSGVATACGERPLDVDHIIPRSRGGRTELANLQALCSKCNRSKRNQDETDFRSWPHPSADPDCVFCGPDLMSKAIEKNGSVFAIEDEHPVTHGHVLVIPIRHTSDLVLDDRRGEARRRPVAAGSASTHQG
jgi:hypothetical protein